MAEETFAETDGVYDDMMGGYDSPDIKYVTIDGERYRTGSKLRDRVGPAITYNSGTMLSGAADLFRVTSDATYQTDLAELTDNSFAYFAKPEAAKPGCYTFDVSGFCNWFNGVLMRGYVDAYSTHTAAASCIEAFQNNLDYAYENYQYKHMLPTNLLVGGTKLKRTRTTWKECSLLLLPPNMQCWRIMNGARNNFKINGL